VETWRERYPYDARMPRSQYEREKRLLQIQLLKLQRWTKRTGARHLILFEGRDAAGKGGTIKRFMEHLNPRGARVVALEKPTETEQGQWYFQRYVAHLPGRGEMVLFDRSWYNRAGVEKVMGFCTREEHAEFLRRAPQFEDMLVSGGISLFKATDTDYAPWILVKRNDKSAPDSTPCATYSTSSTTTTRITSWSVSPIH
jgi:polyphosphate kinase 2 (PPK2 family)